MLQLEKYYVADIMKYRQGSQAWLKTSHRISDLSAYIRIVSFSYIQISGSSCESEWPISQFDRLAAEMATLRL